MSRIILWLRILITMCILYAYIFLLCGVFTSSSLVFDISDDDYTCVLLPGFLLSSGQLSTPGKQPFLDHVDYTYCLSLNLALSYDLSLVTMPLGLHSLLVSSTYCPMSCYLSYYHVTCLFIALLGH